MTILTHHHHIHNSSKNNQLSRNHHHLESSPHHRTTATSTATTTATLNNATAINPTTNNAPLFCLVVDFIFMASFQSSSESFGSDSFSLTIRFILALKGLREVWA